MVSFAMEIGSQETTFEMRADAFLANVGVARRGDLYTMNLGPRLRLVMPRVVEKELVLDLLATMDHEDAVEVLRSMEERMR